MSELELSTRENYLSSIAKIQQYLLAVDTKENYHSHILEMLGNASGACHVFIYRDEIHSDNSTMLLLSEWMKPDNTQDGQSAEYIIQIPEFQEIETTLRRGEIVNVQTSGVNNFDVLRLTSKSANSVLLFPLISQNTFLGFIGYSSIEKNKWSNDEVELLKTTSTSIAIYEENRSQELLNATRDKYLTGANNIQKYFCTTELSKIDVSKVLSTVANLADVDRIVVYLNGEINKKDTKFVATYQWNSFNTKPLNDSVFTQKHCYLRGLNAWYKKLICDKEIAGNISAFSDFEYIFLKDKNVNSVLIIPLIANSELIGFVEFDNCSEKKDWQKHEIDLLRTVVFPLNNYYWKIRNERIIRNLNAKIDFLHNDSQVGLWFFQPLENTWFVHDNIRKILNIKEKKPAKEIFNLLNKSIEIEDRRRVFFVRRKLKIARINSYSISYTIGLGQGKFLRILETATIDEFTTNHRVKKIFGTINNISNYYATKQKLLKKEQQLIVAQSSKKVIVEKIDYNIRNAVNGIIGLADLAQTTNKPNNNQTFEKIKEAAYKLFSITSNIHIYTLIKDNNYPAISNDFILTSILSQVLKTVNYEIKFTTSDLSTVVERDVPTHLNGDAGGLYRILYNLVRFSLQKLSSKKCSIIVRMHSCKNQKSKYRIINSKKPIRLEFTIINEVSKSTVERESIIAIKPDSKNFFSKSQIDVCKYLIEQADGELWDTTNKNEHSINFTMRFNASENVEFYVSTEQFNNKSSLELLPKNILVAEDDWINREFITGFFKNSKHKMTIVQNGNQVLEILEKEKFDLIFMDIEMPFISGDVVTQIIRKNKNGIYDADIPIIAMTAKVAPSEVIKYKAVGMDDYISKPGGFNNIDDLIKRVLLKKGRPLN